MKLPDNHIKERIWKLVYANYGGAVIALADDGVHKMWKWHKSEGDETESATADEAPQLWQPPSGITMINDADTDTAVPCLTISKNYYYIISSSGGKVSLFNLATFKKLKSFVNNPPTPTCIVLNPRDNNKITVGLANGTIEIFNVLCNQVTHMLFGHQKSTSVTGLAYANDKNILVSSGADAKICIWDTESWEIVAAKILKLPCQRSNNPSAGIRVYFNLDYTHLLVVHQSQIALYDPENLDCLMKWVPQQARGSITDALYSCNGESVFVSMEDESVNILTSSDLRVTCRISYAAYMPTNRSELRVWPTAIAAHPSKPNQIALGLSDGSVYVLEPLESDKDWGTEKAAVGTVENTVAVEP